MRTKYLCGLSFVAGIIISGSVAVIAKRPPLPPVAYGDNQFDWFANVPDKPGGNDVVESHIELIGAGGIRVNAQHENGGAVSGKYRVYIDGANMSAPAVSTSKIDSDFNAAPGCAYFVKGNATCTLPSAVELAGKEILVWNAGPSVTVRYNTVMNQQISGSASGALTNSTAFRLERFMSDGANWFKE